MSFAVVHDVAVSWERYAPLAVTISEPPPPGLLIFLAGPTDEGVRFITAWQDEGSWYRFQIERLAPAMASLDGPPPPPPTERQLHAPHSVVVYGEARSTASTT